MTSAKFVARLVSSTCDEERGCIHADGLLHVISFQLALLVISLRNACDLGVYI